MKGGSPSNATGSTGRSKGHGEAVQDIYRRHQAELCRHIRKTFGIGPPDPEDVVQTAFARFAALPTPDTIENPRAYLFRTAHNIAIDARRSMGRFDAVARDVGTIEGDSHECDASDVLSSREELARLDAALARLSDRQRTALLMHRLDDLSFAEIGRRFGMTGAGARKLVLTALAACITTLEDPE